MTSHAATSEVAITRVINPCALIEIGSDAILTDPYFTDHWFFPMHEPIGVAAAALPHLTAILGGHGVFDHWQPRSMVDSPKRLMTPVFVATNAMARKARRAGFRTVEVLRWGDSRKLSDTLTVTTLPGERSPFGRTNNYLLSSVVGVSVFVSTEARLIGPIEQCAAEHQVDIAVLPIDGLSVLGRQLVMNAAQALNAAKVLGAHTLVPIHCSQRSIRPILRQRTGIDDLLRLAPGEPSIGVCHTRTGERMVVG
jgi:L-ascorbate metabolism protein UlaG (beta-lactamase superfamily)